MDARFELKLEQSDKRDLHGTGMSEAAMVRFGLRWMQRRLDVIAAGDDKKLAADLRAMIDEMRTNPAFAPKIPALEASLSALDAEADTNRGAAALYDMLGMVAGEPLPVVERLRLMNDIAEFEGRLTFREMPAPVKTEAAHERK